MSGEGGSYPGGRQYDIPTSGFDLSAALVAAGADIDYSANLLRGIECHTADGNVVVKLRDDTVAITLSLTVGQRWVGSIKTVVFSGTDTGLGLRGLR